MLCYYTINIHTKIQYSKVSISTIKDFTRAIFKIIKYLFTLGIEYLLTLKYFVIFWDFWSFGYLATLVFSPLLVPICKFLQNQDRFVKLWFLPETLVKQNHKTLLSPKIAKKYRNHFQQTQDENLMNEIF